MNMFKRFFALLMTLCMVLTLVPVSVFAEEAGETEQVTEGTIAPTEEETSTPSEGDASEGAEEETPADSEEETPADSEEETPADSEEETPADSEEETPADSEEETPAASDEETPAASDDEETPAASDEETPAASDEETPAASDEEVPADNTNEQPADAGAAASADAGLSVASNDDIMTTATTTPHTDSKPDDGTVTGEPFDTSVSENYRIPGLVNFNGTLIATADARWDYEKDGGGMDLVVSRSTDGNTWSYTFAGYLGDNGNVWNAASSTLMDPVIITDGTTLYLLADMFPAGYSLSTGNTTNAFSDTDIGFDANGNLLLSDDGRSTYGYYLKDGKIYATNGTEQTGYTVRDWYDLYYNDEYVTNLFFADSPFQVRATSYICMSTSTDGVNWTAPTLLNVKPTGVSWMVLGPGSGLVTSDGYIAFTAYDGSNIYLIYGKDGNWNRVQTSAASNESSIIELNDGTIRAFVKRGSSNTIAYVDFTKNSSGGYTAGTLVDTGVTNFSQCMVSSLHYSKTLNGQEVVLVCCPSKPGSGAWNGRFNGKIHLFTLDSNNAMTLVGSYALNSESEFFAYSNMAEMADGTIAVLYEDDCISYAAGNYYGNASHITYTNVNLETALNVTFDEVVYNTDTDVTVFAPDLSRIEVELQDTSTPAAGYNRSVTYSITLYNSAGVEYEGSATVKIPVPAEFTGATMYTGSVDGDTFAVGAPADGYFTVTVPHFSDVTISAYVADNTPTTVDVILYVGDSKTFTIDGFAYSENNVTVQPNTSNVTMHVDGETVPANTTLVEITSLDQIVSGNSYLICTKNNKGLLSNDRYNGDSWIALQILTETASVNSTELWTITGSNGVYQIHQGDSYLNITSSAVSMGSAQDLTIAWSETAWVISDGNNHYLNNYGGDNDDAGVWTDIDDGSRWYIYEIVSTDVTSYTEVTFTGEAKGTTTATVGHVTYNITVIDKADTAEGDIAGLSAVVVTKDYPGDTEDVALKGKEVNALTTSAGSTFQLGVNLADADLVSWSTADANVAIVDQDGNVTGVAEGNTTVTATVYKDGVYETITIPVYVLPSFGTGDEMTTVCYYVEELVNTSAYYSLYSTNVTAELQSVVEGQVIFFERPVAVPFGMVWTSTPDKGYALTYMAATDSQAQYYPLHTGNDVLADADGYYMNSSANSGPYYNLFTYYGVDQDELDDMLDLAVTNKGCDGAMSMGRKANDGSPNLGTRLSFRSEQLPTVEKTITGVLGTTGLREDWRVYEENMTASVGEYVLFALTITKYDAVDVVDYSVDGSTVILTDLMEGAILTDGTFTYDQATGVTFNVLANAQQNAEGQYYIDMTSLFDDAGTEGFTQTYYVAYKITQENLPEGAGVESITNSASLAYTYQSQYSTGSLSAVSEAKAEINVVGSPIKAIVVDFGLPVTITGLTEAQGFNNISKAESTATYGTVTISGDATSNWSVTYTPTTVMMGADTIILRDANGNFINSIVVYPATTVYYEEGFASYTGTWDSTGSMGSGSQQLQYAGESGNNFGYDGKYAAETGMSNGTQATSLNSASGNEASFVFSGTGVDIYANCDTGTDIVIIMLYTGTGDSKSLHTLYQVDTANRNGTSEATDNQDTAMQALPIVSVDDLPYGTYTVVIKPTSYTGDFHFDGFRVYSTMGYGVTFYPSYEQNVSFIEVRDEVLTAVTVTSETTDEQVYSASNMLGNVVYLSNSANANDLLMNGPKNELWLWSAADGQGETITFNLAVAGQIGLKAPNGAVEATISVTVYDDTNTAQTTTETIQISSATDMFYDVPAGMVTIQVTSTSGILSVTKLKVPNVAAPAMALGEVSQEQIRFSLRRMGVVLPDNESNDELPEDTTTETPEDTTTETPEDTTTETPEDTTTETPEDTTTETPEDTTTETPEDTTTETPEDTTGTNSGNTSTGTTSGNTGSGTTGTTGSTGNTAPGGSYDGSENEDDGKENSEETPEESESEPTEEEPTEAPDAVPEETEEETTEATTEEADSEEDSKEDGADEGNSISGVLVAVVAAAVAAAAAIIGFLIWKKK